MDNELSPYECQFTPEERKAIIAQTMVELRKTKGYTQKQVAAFIEVKPTTYNSYETGRTEPPAEILVRLSYLYQVSLDILMQKDRLSRTSQDILRQLNKYKQQVKQMEEQLVADGGNNPAAQAFLEAMSQMMERMKDLNDNPAVQAKLEEPLKP